jgi:hypothetical protein
MADLAAMAGKTFRVRFAFYLNGSRYTSTTDGIGWYLDAITFADVLQFGATSTGVFTTNTPTLPAPEEEAWIIEVTPVAGDNSFPGSTQTLEVLDVSSFADWAAYYEAAGGLAAGSLTANSDPDKDGRTSAFEFAFGSNPVVADPTPAGFPSIQPSSTHFVMRYQIDTALTGVTITPEAGSGLGSWYTPGQPGAPSGFTDSPASSVGTLQTREAAIPRGSGPAVFMRLRATVP